MVMMLKNILGNSEKTLSQSYSYISTVFCNLRNILNTTLIGKINLIGQKNIFSPSMRKSEPCEQEYS